MATKNAYPLVHVEWVDSFSMNGWISQDEGEEWAANRSVNCETTGFLYYECKTHIVVAQSIVLHSKSVDALMKIPRSAIVKIRKLRRAGS